MKKIILIFVFIFSLFASFNVYWSCSYDENDSTSIVDNLNDCLSWTDLVNAWNAKIEDWFWDYIKTWTNNIALYLWVFAVFAIVFGSIMLTISAWEDEKISKAKNIIKWWILGFLAVISASFIINLIIRIVYNLW